MHPLTPHMNFVEKKLNSELSFFSFTLYSTAFMVFVVINQGFTSFLALLRWAIFMSFWNFYVRKSSEALIDTWLLCSFLSILTFLSNWIILWISSHEEKRKTKKNDEGKLFRIYIFKQLYPCQGRKLANKGKNLWKNSKKNLSRRIFFSRIWNFSTCEI